MSIHIVCCSCLSALLSLLFPPCKASLSLSLSLSFFQAGLDVEGDWMLPLLDEEEEEDGRSPPPGPGAAHETPELLAEGFRRIHISRRDQGDDEKLDDLSTTSPQHEKSRQKSSSSSSARRLQYPASCMKERKKERLLHLGCLSCLPSPRDSTEVFSYSHAPLSLSLFPRKNALLSSSLSCSKGTRGILSVVFLTSGCLSWRTPHGATLTAGGWPLRNSFISHACTQHLDMCISIWRSYAGSISCLYLSISIYRCVYMFPSRV